MNKHTFKARTKKIALTALPYATGALSGIAIMAFSYWGAKAGALKGLDGLTYEFNFVSKEGDVTKIK